MSLCVLHRYSDFLQKQVAMNVILPDNQTGPFAVFYLLHGLSDDYTNWLRRTRIELYMAGQPMIVVTPDGFRGFYTNSNEGIPYARYIAEETVDFIDQTFPTKRSRAGRCIGGLSMGGYGALRLGLEYADRFASVVSHSGALMVGSRVHKKGQEPFKEGPQVFGRNPVGTSHDLLHHARLARKRNLLPKIRIDCGTEDQLLASNRRVHAEFEKLKIPHEYEEFPGGHTWDYWDLHVRDAIAFHAKNLKLTKAQ